MKFNMPRHYQQTAEFAPSRGRELKYQTALDYVKGWKFAPSRGRELK